jgi:ABC-type proline/glycine betaine transport system ATPase subunit
MASSSESWERAPALSWLSRAERDARARDVVVRLGLTERVLDQFPMELSAGQQQRVGIGRAIRYATSAHHTA